MKTQRRIARIATTSAPEPGFMGAGHEAVMVVNPTDFSRNDPFIALMDDRVDRPAGPLGGAHPHAGFETVTLMIEGEVRDRDEGLLTQGDALWMTAGSGVIHNEDMTSLGGKVRILQLWLTLSKADRKAEPRFELIQGSAVPVLRERGAEVRLYSGSTLGMTSATRNHVPVTLAEIRLDAHAAVEVDLPATFGGFVYALEGRLRVGEDDAPLHAGQVGWLDRPEQGDQTSLRVAAVNAPARILLYAGLPTGDPIVTQGPFVGDSSQDITQSYREYLAGKFPRMSELAVGQGAVAA